MKLNRYEFIGHLGQDCEVRDVNGRAAISFSVAVTEKWTNQQGAAQEKTYWMRCTLWRNQGQTAIANYLKKGQLVFVEGKPEARAYVTKDGQAAASLEVTVSNVELLGGGQQQQAAPMQQPIQQPQPQQVRQSPSQGFYGGSGAQPMAPQPAAAPAPQMFPQNDDVPF